MRLSQNKDIVPNSYSSVRKLGFRNGAISGVQKYYVNMTLNYSQKTTGFSPDPLRNINQFVNIGGLIINGK